MQITAAMFPLPAPGPVPTTHYNIGIRSQKERHGIKYAMAPEALLVCAEQGQCQRRPAMRAIA